MRNRYSVSKFDSTTFQVVDNVKDIEVCTTGESGSRHDERARAKRIARLLNADERAKAAAGKRPRA